MKKLLIIIPLLLLLSGCWNKIKKWDIVRCWDLFTYQFDVQVIYSEWDMIYWSWSMEETIYWNYDMNESWYTYRKSEWQRTFNVNKDECFRIWMDWEAIDRIRIYKNREKENDMADNILSLCRNNERTKQDVLDILK